MSKIEIIKDDYAENKQWSDDREVNIIKDELKIMDYLYGKKLA